MSKLINKAAVRRAALEIAAQNRAHTFTRVSTAFLDAIEADVRNVITRRIEAHPSTGKTLMG